MVKVVNYACSAFIKDFVKDMLHKAKLLPIRSSSMPKETSLKFSLSNFKSHSYIGETDIFLLQH